MKTVVASPEIAFRKVTSRRLMTPPAGSLNRWDPVDVDGSILRNRPSRSMMLEALLGI